ncbi:MAG: hypothetical protein PIR02_15820 [Microbacterium enclense]
MRRTILWAVAAGVALLCVPLLYSIGALYGVETLVWDPLSSTFTYQERPGGFAAIVTTMVMCAALLSFSLTGISVAVVRLVRGRLRTSRSTASPRA